MVADSQTQKRYKSAPITEAVIELRIQPREPFDHTALSDLAHLFKADFPKTAPLRLVQMGVSLHERSSDARMTSSQQAIGFRLSKADDSRILQIRRDGFAYSHMAPYSEWAIFRAEATGLWKRYQAAFPEIKLARCGLRYINRVDVPMLRVELEDYFRMYPKIPDEMPQPDVTGMA